jgi:hypothetical protein
MTFDQHLANWATAGVFLLAVLAALVGVVRWAVKRLEAFIDDRLTDGAGVPLARALRMYIERSELRFARIEQRQQTHDEAIAMWKTLGKIADARPGLPDDD